VFCHFSGIQDGNCLREGDEVEFEVVYDDRRGKDRAENVTGGFYEDRPSGGGDQGGGGRGQGECYDWRDGRCNRGSSCRFSHDGPGGSGGGGGGDDRRGGGGGGGGYDDRRGGGGGGYDDRRDDRDRGRRDDRY